MLSTFFSKKIREPVLSLRSRCIPTLERLEERYLLATTVQLSIEADAEAGIWRAFADITEPETTTGIASFRLDVVGTNGLTVLDESVLEADEFSLFASSGSFGIDIHGSQDTFSNFNVVGGIGLDSPVLLASGKFSGTSGILTVLDHSASGNTGFVLLSSPVVNGGVTGSEFADVVISGTVNVNLVSSPVALDDEFFVAQDSVLNVSYAGILANDTFTGEQSLSTQLTQDVEQGSLELHPDGTFIYTPDTGFFGVDSFRYKAVGSGDSSSQEALVTIHVNQPSLPFGATADDTAELMLGDVLVTVVLLESDGSIDPDSEIWTPGKIQNVKNNVRQGLTWWEDVLDLEGSVHDLHFSFDFTYADNPVSTGYEPIARPSNDFTLWLDDFLDLVGQNNSPGFSDDIRAFNHQQRLAYGTDWAFTIFVVNSAADSDGRFAPGGDFSRAFAFSGGRFFVMPSTRPVSSVAHEAGHVFYALDESANSRSYNSSRGYYNTQNLNAFDDNPNPNSRVSSIMAAHETAFANHAVSPSAKKMLGWQDSDGDGIFDVLDVPLSLSGTGMFDPQSGEYRFSGSSTVGTLPNLNPSGLGNDITLNEISRVQYRLDGGAWIDAGEYRTSFAELNLTIGPLSPGSHDIEIRTIDDQTQITSNVFQGTTDHPTSTLTPGINGFLWNDEDADGIWDPQESALSGWTVQALGLSGQPLSGEKGVEPDDYSHGINVSNVIPEVSLTAIGSEIIESRVTSRNQSAATTGDRVFSHRTDTGWNSFWTSESRQLLIEFSSPVTTVSLDAGSNSNLAFGRLEIYDINDNLLERYTTQGLARREAETMTLSRPAAEIAYVIAGGHAGTTVALDNLRFGSQDTAETDTQGAYSLAYLPPGSYQVKAIAPAGWSATSGTTQTVSVSENIPAGNVNFGFFQSGKAWQNLVNRFDVDGNGIVNSLDLLKLIRDINTNGNRLLLTPPNEDQHLFIDVNGDDVVNPVDVVQVITEINRIAAEGESLEVAEGGNIYFALSSQFIDYSEETLLEEESFWAAGPETGFSFTNFEPTLPSKRTNAIKDSGDDHDASEHKPSHQMIHERIFAEDFLTLQTQRQTSRSRDIDPPAEPRGIFPAIEKLLLSSPFSEEKDHWNNLLAHQEIFQGLVDYE